jgi:putative phosphoesterase
MEKLNKNNSFSRTNENKFQRSELMEKVAIIGDFHIPGRAKEIPLKLMIELNKECPEKILCTGDLTEKRIFNALESVCPVLCVAGNMDYDTKFNTEEAFKIGGHKIGLIHGKGVYPRGDNEQLLRIAENLGVDILINGHTHILEIKKYKKKLFLNPGTATGAWSGGGDEPNPSFLILILNDKIKVKTIELIDSGIKKKTKEIKLQED